MKPYEYLKSENNIGAPSAPQKLWFSWLLPTSVYGAINELNGTQNVPIERIFNIHYIW